MRFILLTVLILHIVASIDAQTKRGYLKENCFDLNQDIDFPESNFNVVGFGAMHGSSKTEAAELALLISLLKTNEIAYYIIESDFSTGYFFNEYLKSGDTSLLKELVYHYGIGIPQEKSIETFNKWKRLRKLNLGLPVEKRLHVVVIDPIANYKFTFRHILALCTEVHELPVLSEIKNQIKLDSTDFSPNYESHSKTLLKRFIKEMTSTEITEISFELRHLIDGIRLSFDASDREDAIFQNYINLSESLAFHSKKQFIRYGFFHLEKEREYQNYPSFFTRLIENEIYDRNSVITVMGYLTKSEVLWDVESDEKGKYTSYTTKAGFGISDYWKEYFRGIGKLKKEKLSDLTLFRLNQSTSPYHRNVPDLIQIKMLFSRSNRQGVKGKSCTRFIDYALLISNSQANRPIEELEW